MCHGRNLGATSASTWRVDGFLYCLLGVACASLACLCMCCLCLLNVFDVHLDGGQSEIYEDIIFTNYFSYPDLQNQTSFHEVLTKLVQALEDEHKKHFKFIPVLVNQSAVTLKYTRSSK